MKPFANHNTEVRSRLAGDGAHDRLLWVFMLFSLGLGVYLRLKQFPGQVLLDDEWHAVYQLLKGKSPGELFLTLGKSDYSIPLGLLYWLESRWFGLSEFAMRWPMLIAGLATLGLFTGFAMRRFGPAVAAVFAFLLALSPMLIIYGHTARPYALTLLLSYAALYAFYRYWAGGLNAVRWGGVYCLAAALCIWLHPVTGPFLVSPFLLQLLRMLRSGHWVNFRRLVLLAVPAALLMCALILPPLLADSEALTVKAGVGAISLDTMIGVWFMWLGTPSGICVVALLVLAAIGLRPMLAAAPVARSAVLGLLLTLLALIFSQPAWVQHALTLGRYLLPALPLLLLAAAVGVVTIWRTVEDRRGVLGWVFSVSVLAVLVIYLAESPVRRLASAPNSHITHLVLQFDFRDEHNRMLEYQEDIPWSDFWQWLARQEPGSLTVAVAPFYYESFNWDGPRREHASGQRILPAYLTGYCVPKRYGEVPDNEQFRFRNAWYLSSLEDSAAAWPDWLVYTKPFKGFLYSREDQLVGGEVAACEQQLRSDLGDAHYEDDYLLAYDLRRLKNSAD